MERTHINTLQFITLDEKEKSRVIWATVNTKEKALERMEYLINSVSDVNQFYAHELSSDRAVKMIDLYRRLK